MRERDSHKEKYLCDEEKFVKILQEKFEKYRENFIKTLCDKKIKFHNRAPDMLAHLKIGFEKLLDFLVDEEQISVAEMKKYVNTFDELLIENTAGNSEIIINENPVNVFCDKLRSLLDSGRCYAEVRGAESIPRQKNCIGLQDDQYYYLFMDAALSEVRKLCTELGESFTVKKNELLKQLRKEGLIVSRTSRNTISIRDNGGAVINVAMLDKQKINERLSRDLCPPGGEVGKTAER